MAVVIARTFGASASGEFFLAFSIVNVLGMVGRLGSENQAVKVLPRLLHEHNLDAFWGHLKWLRKVCRGGSWSAAGLAFAAGAFLSFAYEPSQFGPQLMILAVSIPFSSSAILESSALRAAGLTSRGAFAETGLSQGLTIVSLLTLAALFPVAPIAIAICYTVSSAATAVIAHVWSRRGIAGGELPIRSRTDERRDATFGSMIHMMGSSVLFFALTSSPVFILGLSSTVRDIGLFNAAARASTLISLIPALQTTYLIPRVALAVDIGHVDEANRLLRRAVRQASVVTVIVALIILFFSHQVMSIFGSEFEPARSTLIVLTIGQTLLIFLGNVNPVMAVVGLERASLVTVGAVLVLGCVPMFYAASLWGALGASFIYMAMSVLYSTACIVLLIRSKGLRPALI
jgi:O-antigen/teichoic acid export membrane protein